MKIKLTLVAIFGAFLSILVINSIWFSRISIWNMPMLLNGTRAKEFCSCYFILQKGKEYCLDAVLHGYPQGGLVIDEDKQFVQFSFLWNSRSASISDKKYGCELQ